MTMELRQVRYAVAVFEELHFGRAAAREHITASALSQQVARLERELGVLLFHRSPRRVSVTPAGEAFVKQARAALAAMDEAAATARAAARAPAGPLVIGFTSHGAGALMAPLLRQFAADHPQVVVQLRELDFVAHFSAMAAATVDAQFVRLPVAFPAGVRVRVLGAEPRMVALPPGHRLCTVGDLAEPVPAAELADETFFALPPEVPADWVAHFAPWGTRPESVPIGTVGEVLTLVAAGSGVALLPASLARHTARPDVVFRSARVEPSRLALAWRSSPTADAFAALAVSLVSRQPTLVTEPAGVDACDTPAPNGLTPDGDVPR
jgi:DNA-binding transcriptional LysR family regulator